MLALSDIVISMLKSIKGNQVFKLLIGGGVIFYLLSGVSSLINYALYPALARFLNVTDYGEVQFLISMFTQLAIGFVVLNILAIIVTAKAKSNEESSNALTSLTFISTIFAVILSLIGGALLFVSAEDLNISHPLSIVALCLALLINVPFTIVIGSLQGQGRFVSSSILGLSGALGKFIFSLLFVALGFGVIGAVSGVFVGMLASVIGYFIFSAPSKRRGIALNFHPKKHLAKLRHIKWYAVSALVGVSFVTLLSSIDSIVSRIVLSGEDAGEYATIATLAKMILAATAPLIWLALPSAVKGDTKTIYKFLFLTFIVAAVGTVILSTYPQLLIQIILGYTAVAFTNLMLLASISMSLCSVAFIAVAAFLCMGATRMTIINSLLSTILFIVVFILVSSSQGTLTATLVAQAAASVFISILTLIGIHRLHVAKKAQSIDILEL